MADYYPEAVLPGSLKPMGAPIAESWTLKSVLIATGLSLSLVLVVVQLRELGLRLTVGWETVILPALGGATFLGLRHRGTWLLSFLVFLPLMTFVLVLVVVSMGVAEGNDL
jgi:hypothetical protein